jgi:signal transduction histidine kinase/DNA-binding response OmpR family regulator/methyl-accepting chemotaxis protein
MSAPRWYGRMNLRGQSLKRKLLLITMLTSALALLLSSMGFLAYDLVAFRARMGHDLMTQAQIIGSNSMAALAFQDDGAVSEILSALKAKDEIAAAAIYTPDGRLFAAYRRTPSDSGAFPSRPETSGSRFDGNHLTVFHQIVLHEQTLGTLFIKSGMQEWHARLKRYSGIVGVLMLGSALVALLVSSRLQRVISEPILDLQRTMSTISAQKNFALRVAKTQEDEIGELIDGFNTMLAEIQQRDAALHRANDDLTAQTRELEQQVVERLRAQEELKTLNSTLEQRVAERSAAAEARALDLARSERALQTQTRILQSILDSMSDGVIVADDGGRFILVNPAAERMLHLQPADRPTGTWAERHGLFLPDMVTPYPTEAFPLMRAVGGVAVDAAEVFVRHARAPEGKWLSANATPLTDEGGVVHNGVAVFRDITAHKRVEEELLKAKEAAEAANRAKSQFLANMSHELRTPLNAIIGYSEMLREQAQDLGQDDSIADLDKIHSAGKHLQSLINDILDLSKIEAGKMELFLETFSVSALVDDVVTTVHPLVEKNGNTLAVERPADLGVMHADMTKVRQVLFNLLSNACKFTEQGAVRLDVTRRMAHDREWIQFRVHDTGIGMTSEQIARLFQEFTQVDASTTRKYGGTGLGLAISRRFCEMMDGRIDVQSELGSGSTFLFEIPTVIGVAADDEPFLVVDRPTGIAEPIAATSGTVLVIDDDPAVRDLMARFLAKDGFHVVCASSGKEGLALARSVRPAAITLDVLMPGMDGWAVLALLKDDDELSETPVVMVTMTDDRRRGYALGASDYLTKPIDPTRLARTLRAHGGAGLPASVLVVDDDPRMRELARRVLKKEGWDVHEAENGRVALHHLSERRPDVIVLDLMMPVMDGFEFILELRTRAAWRDIPVVVVTAKDVTAEDCLRLNGSVDRIMRKAAHQCEDLLNEVRQQVKACLRLEALTP